MTTQLAELPGLTQDELRRYSRHLLLSEVGVDGQRRLKAASVLLVGAGGLGSPAALYLAAAGVGRLGLVDFDTVDESNLQRQVLYGTGSVGRPKLDCAAERIADLNPHVQIELHGTRLDAENALDLVRSYDVIVDGTDNFATRYLVNDACVLAGRPNVHGSIFRFDGQVSIFAAADGPCYRCVYPTPPPAGLVPSCAEAGVLGVLPGLVGTIQATETLKLLLGQGTPLIGRLLVIEALDMTFRSVRLRRDPRCPACGTRTITQLVEVDVSCAAPAPAADAVPGITPRELAEQLARGEPLELLDVREQFEWEIAHLPGARLEPLSGWVDGLPSIDAGRRTVVYCKGGARSTSAVRKLRRAGFERVENLEGGILRWSEEVDPSLPRY